MNRVEHNKEYVERKKKEIEALEKEKASLLQRKGEQYGEGKSFHNPLEVDIIVRQTDEQVRGINYRIRTIQNELLNTKIIDECDKIYKVIITTAKGDCDTHELYVTDKELDPSLKRCTLNSILGKALRAHKAGDTFKYTLPSKEVRIATILSERNMEEEQM